MERKLASIQRIREMRPIEGADAIELAIVNSWQVVVAKNACHQVGDLVVYCEIDSYLPIEPEFEFLRKSSYKKMSDGTEGFRLKTIKLRGQVSQGLIIPLPDAIDMCVRKHSKGINDERSELSIRIDYLLDGWNGWFDGLNVTEMLGIIKYEPHIPAELSGKVKGNFPSFLRKTDEERVQNLTDEYTGWVFNKTRFYASEKLDGSSATFYLKDGIFGVCSRNLELAEPEPYVPGTVICEDGIERPKQENTFWKVARELDLKAKLASTGRNICLQGELIGEGIQKNPYKLKGQTIKFYNAFDIDEQKRLEFFEFIDLIFKLGLDTVPIMEAFVLPHNVDELLRQAEGKSVLNPATEREGLVIRSLDIKISFKAISNKFLLKNEE
jgi:RNA ligase (TIGR02306 family)